MKKKGFTLIELLAVIVILAIIALISVPMIFGIIGKVKKGALGSTASGLLESATLYYANNLETSAENKEFLFDETYDGQTTEGESLSYKGDFTGTGSVRLYADGKTAICITDGTYYAIKNISDTAVTTGTGTCSFDEASQTYLSTNLVSQDLVDALQAELDNIEDQKQLLVDALVSKGVDATIDEDLSSLAAKVNAMTLGKQIITLGSSASFDLKTNYATYGLSSDDYASLTSDNFIVSVTGIGANSTVPTGYVTESNYSWSSTSTVTKTYDSTTGVITLSGYSKSGTSHVTTYNYWANIVVYLVY